MTWTLLIVMCLGINCAPVPLPSPGLGYRTEQACREAGRRQLEALKAEHFYCRPRMDPSGEREA